jgi:hypothetical protein
LFTPLFDHGSPNRSKDFDLADPEAQRSGKSKYLKSGDKIFSTNNQSTKVFAIYEGFLASRAKGSTF